MDIIQEHIDILRAHLATLERTYGPVRKYRAGRNCQRGYNCGGSCITRRKNCRKALEGEAKNFGEWMVAKMSANIGAVVGDKPAEKKIMDRKTMTPEEVAAIKPRKERVKRTVGLGRGSYDVENDVEYYNDAIAIVDRRNIEDGKKSNAAMGVNYQVGIVDPKTKQAARLDIGRSKKSNNPELGYYKTKRSAMSAAKELLEKGLTGEVAQSIVDANDAESWRKFKQDIADVHEKYIDH